MRICFKPPAGRLLRLHYLDSLHAGLIKAWLKSGAEHGQVLGPAACGWSFGAEGALRRGTFEVRSIAVGAEGPLENILIRMTPDLIRCNSVSGDKVDLSEWDRNIAQLPVVASQSKATLAAKMLSPLALSVPLAERNRGRKWYDNLSKVGPYLEPAICSRLSRLTGRMIRLEVEPDRLYLRANPRHSVLVNVRRTKSGRPVFVVGLMCPISLSGSYADLKSAWALGIGEKNRYGFGCIGHLGT